MKSIENRTRLIVDLFFCLAFMPSVVLLGPAHHWISLSAVFFGLVTGYLYLCYFVLRVFNLPKLFVRKHYLRIAVVVAMLVAGTYVLTLYPLPGLDFVLPSLSAYQTRVRDWGVAMTTWLMFLLVTGYSLTTSLVMELYDQLLLRRRIEAERDKDALAMFKAQISPHFLFNTLNSLYSLVIGTSPKAEDAFIRFTDILKYTYTAVGRETVPVAEEIKYIQSYIALQQIRLDGHTTVVQDYDVDTPQLAIPPMLMLTFVENAFKYGASTSRDCTVSIRLRLRDGCLLFETVNSVMRHADEFRTEVPRGLENCRARLAAIYPGRHSLETVEQGDTFTLCMKIMA